MNECAYFKYYQYIFLFDSYGWNIILEIVFMFHLGAFVTPLVVREYTLTPPPPSAYRQAV